MEKKALKVLVSFLVVVFFAGCATLVDFEPKTPDETSIKDFFLKLQSDEISIKEADEYFRRVLPILETIENILAQESRQQNAGETT